MRIDFNPKAAVDIACDVGPLQFESFVSAPIAIEEEPPILRRPESELFTLEDLVSECLKLGLDFKSLGAHTKKYKESIISIAGIPAEVEQRLGQLVTKLPVRFVSGEIEGGVKLELSSGKVSMPIKEFGEVNEHQMFSISKSYALNGIIGLNLQELISGEDKLFLEEGDPADGRERAKKEESALDSMQEFFTVMKSIAESSSDDGHTETSPLGAYFTVALEIIDLGEESQKISLKVTSHRNYFDPEKNNQIAEHYFSYHVKLTETPQAFLKILRNGEKGDWENIGTFRPLDDLIVKHFLLEFVQWGREVYELLQANPWLSEKPPVKIRTQEEVPSCMLTDMPKDFQEWENFLLGINITMKIGGTLREVPANYIKNIRSNPEARAELERVLLSLSRNEDPFPEEDKFILNEEDHFSKSVSGGSEGALKVLKYICGADAQFSE